MTVTVKSRKLAHHSLWHVHPLQRDVCSKQMHIAGTHIYTGIG